MASIFSRIVVGEIPCYKISEDENYLAFLDVFPLKKGHVLVIPKTETDYVFDLDSKTYEGLMSFSRRIAGAIKKSIDCKRVSLHIVGLEVPHAHVHLIPIDKSSDCNFENEKLSFTKEEFELIAEQIKAAL